LTLSHWIEKEGAVKVALLLGVTDANVRSWRARKTLPRPALMHDIQKLSGGKVTYATMIDPFINHHSKTKK